MGGRRRDEVSTMHDNFPLANRFQQCVAQMKRPSYMFCFLSRNFRMQLLPQQLSFI